MRKFLQTSFGEFLMLVLFIALASILMYVCNAPTSLNITFVIVFSVCGAIAFFMTHTKPKG